MQLLCEGVLQSDHVVEQPDCQQVSMDCSMHVRNLMYVVVQVV